MMRKTTRRLARWTAIAALAATVGVMGEAPGALADEPGTAEGAVVLDTTLSASTGEFVGATHEVTVNAGAVAGPVHLGELTITNELGHGDLDLGTAELSGAVDDEGAFEGTLTGTLTVLLIHFDNEEDGVDVPVEQPCTFAVTADVVGELSDGTLNLFSAAIDVAPTEDDCGGQAANLDNSLAGSEDNPKEHILGLTLFGVEDVTPDPEPEPTPEPVCKVLQVSLKIGLLGMKKPITICI